MGGECITCELGYYCSGDGSKKACPSGTTSKAGASSSSDCKSTPTTCPAGKYKVGGECVTCELGYYCPGNGSKNACPSGTTSKAGASSSSACKSTGATTTCPAGQYYLGQGSGCAVCLAGYYCPGGTFSNGDSSRGGITQCPSGTTSSAGSSSSTACKSTGATTTCSAGQYYAGQGSCAACLSGYYCPGGIFSSGDSSRDGIYSCPANATCTSSSFTCNSGYVKNSAGTACVASGGGNTGGSGSGSGGNGGGNTGGNGSGGNTGGSGSGGNTPTPSNSSSNNGGNNGGNTGGNGNNSGSSNVNQNPGTLTKTPLVIALIGMISVGLGTFTYFKGKKEQNNEI